MRNLSSVSWASGIVLARKNELIARQKAACMAHWTENTRRTRSWRESHQWPAHRIAGAREEAREGCVHRDQRVQGNPGPHPSGGEATPESPWMPLAEITSPRRTGPSGGRDECLLEDAVGRRTGSFMEVDGVSRTATAKERNGHMPALSDRGYDASGSLAPLGGEPPLVRVARRLAAPGRPGGRHERGAPWRPSGRIGPPRCQGRTS